VKISEKWKVSEKGKTLLKCERNKIEELQEISNSKRKCESEK
jgi:hypothetical protein